MEEQGGEDAAWALEDAERVRPSEHRLGRVEADRRS